jgi:hypothetical protein
MKKLSRDGLPVDANEWTQTDWRDLHDAMEKTKKLIANRHKQKETEPNDISTSRPLGRRLPSSKRLDGVKQKGV